jgi:hypothetical protein
MPRPGGAASRQPTIAATPSRFETEDVPWRIARALYDRGAWTRWLARLLEERQDVTIGDVELAPRLVMLRASPTS